MDTEVRGLYIPYTYTYDSFTVFFHDDYVFIGDRDFPIGQCCVDMMNVDASLIEEINHRIWKFSPFGRALPIEQTASAAAAAQEKLNAVWELVFTLPVYRELNIDKDCCYHTFERLLAKKDKWDQVKDEKSPGHHKYLQLMTELEWFPKRLWDFRKRIDCMINENLEPLERRNPAAYALAYSFFYAKMLRESPEGEFGQSCSIEVRFVPMAGRTEEDDIFVAEKATFSRLADFLWTEFYRGLARGNAPRVCQNCGKYFLLTSGYDIRYCNNIAPGETERTCRKVGAHRKESRNQEEYTPAQKEYKRTYNRLKVRKQRKKISEDEWNTAVAQAQDLVAQSERGELTDDELIQRLRAL